MELPGFSVVPDGVGNPVLFLLVGSAAVLLLGVAKSGFGGSAGMLSTPLMVLACGNQAPLATGIMLPLLIACDYVSLAYWWRKWDARNVVMLVPGMVAGIGLGWLTLWLIFRAGHGRGGMAVPNAAVSLCIGLVAVGFVFLQVLRWRRGELKVFRPTALHAGIAGSSAGFVSTIAHTAGPITNMYLLPQQMPKGAFVATTVLYYWIGNQVKLIPYFALGLLSTPSLSADLALLPAVVAGAAAGIFLHNRVNEKWFAVIVYVLLAVIGAYMTVESAITLISRSGS